MKRCMLFLVLAVCAPLTATGADNPIFNQPGADPGEDGTAWVVRYEKTPDAGNKRRDLAVQLQLLPVGDSDTDFTGKLLRYDKVVKVGTDEYYTLREGPLGNLAISGTASKPGSGNSNSRRPLRFTAVGSYVDDGEIHVVQLRGTFHAGRDARRLPRDDAGYAAARTDDRLVMVMKDRTLKSKEKNAGGPGGGPDKSAFIDPFKKEETYRFVFFQAAPDPCDEEPDVDILAEEPYEETLDYAPVP